MTETRALSPTREDQRAAFLARAGFAEAQLDLSRGEDGTGKYLSCTHSTLRQIAERRPSTLAQLQAIQGMGELKIDRFGAAFLKVLREG